MSKELEVFSRIMEIYGKTKSLEGTYNDFLTIKKTLQRLEAIDNANPNEAFKTIYNNIDYLTTDVIIENDEVNDCLKTIKEQLVIIDQALLKAQEQEKENARNEEILQKYYQEGITLDSVRVLKQERDKYKKALEIIKEKRVDMWHLVDLLDQTYDMYVAFCKGSNYAGDYILTQEEFDLLKEVFKNE